MLGILFALGSLALTSFNDFAFKLYAGRERSRGLFFSVIGVVWFLSLLWSFPPPGEVDWRSTVFWGAVSGLFSGGANILLIEGMSRQSAGLCSLIYRLNLVPVVIGAALFLHEGFTHLQCVGIVLALCAVALFQRGGSRSGGAGKTAAGAILLVAAAAVLRAAMGLSYRYAFLHGADKNIVTLINSLFWIFGGAAYAVARERRLLRVDRRMIGYGLVCGLLVGGIVLCMAYSLFYGEAAVVLPIAQMSFIGTFALESAFLKTPCTSCHVAAILCGIAGIVLLSL